MAKKSTEWVKVSGYLFLLGVIIAIIAGLVGGNVIPYTGTILVVIGFIMGLLGAAGMGSITEDNRELMMLAVIALMVVGASGFGIDKVPIVGMYIAPIVNYIAVLVAPAVVILALKAIWDAGSTKYV